MSANKNDFSKKQDLFSLSSVEKDLNTILLIYSFELLIF